MTARLSTQMFCSERPKAPAERQGPQLCLRGTFIDELTCVDVCGPRRSRSAGAATRLQMDKEIFSGERQYVRALVEKLPQLWDKPNSTASSPMDVVASHIELTEENLRGVKDAAAKRSKLNIDNFGSASTTTSTMSGLTLTSIGNEHGSFYQESFWAELHVDNEESSEEDAGPKGYAKASIGAACAKNPGSIGHPELCAYPCAFLAGGHCAGDTNCQFCHGNHRRRPLHLDKRKRVAFKSMSYAECAELLEPLLLKKAAALNLNSDAYVLIDTLVNGNPVASGFAKGATRAKRLKQALAQTMDSMTFITLVTCLIGRPDSPAFTKSEEVQELIFNVRACN